MESTGWLFGLVLAVILMVGGVEGTDLGKIDEILAYVRNQEKETKVLQQLVEACNHEMADMMAGTNEAGAERQTEWSDLVCNH